MVSSDGSGGDGLITNGVCGEHRCDTAGQPHGVVEIEHLVGPVGIRARTEDARDAELRLGKEHAEQVHERDRPALPLHADTLPEEVIRGDVEGSFEPGSERGTVPTRRTLVAVDGHMDPVGRVPGEFAPHGLDGPCWRERRRNAERAAQGEPGRQNVARARDGGQSVGPGDGESRHPGTGGQSCLVVDTHRLDTGEEPELLEDRIAEHRSRLRDLHPTIPGDLDEELAQQDAPRYEVLEARDEEVREPEEVRHDAATPRVHTVLHKLQGQVEPDQPAKRGREPEALVVARAGIETHHERRRADARLEVANVRREVPAPTLLARLDEDHLARPMRPEVVVQPDGADGREHRVPIVRAAAAVELVAVTDRRPGVEPLAPALKLRLFVEVPVEEHRVLRRVTHARDLDEDQGRATRTVVVLELYDLDGRALDARELLAREALEEGDGAVHVTGIGPPRVEARRLVGDADVLPERRDHPSLPVGPHVRETRLRYTLSRHRIHRSSRSSAQTLGYPSIGRRDNNKIGKNMPFFYTPCMALDIYQILDDLALPYTRYDHPAVFTYEEATIHCAHIPGGVCKNLFLRNRKGDKHFLVVVSNNKKADLKKLESRIGERLSFASPERLFEHLGVTPGSVTILGLVHDTDRAVTVLIDKGLWDHEELQMHPLVNTASVVMKRDDVKQFLDWRGNTLRIEYL